MYAFHSEITDYNIISESDYEVLSFWISSCLFHNFACVCYLNPVRVNSRTHPQLYSLYIPVTEITPKVEFYTKTESIRGTLKAYKAQINN